MIRAERHMGRASLFIWCLAFLCDGGLNAQSVATESSVTAVRPNILFILADDLGFGDLACYGHPRTQTPHLDELASQGTRFTQFYVHMLCSPTRVSAITGQFPSRWQIYGHLAAMDDNKRRGMPDWLDEQAPSVPRAMQRAGYQTGLFGKWHLGGGSGSYKNGKIFINHPDAPPVSRYGFDAVRVAFGNGPSWKQAIPVERPHELYPYDEPEWQTYSSRAICDSVIEFLHTRAASFDERPFLVHCWLSDPHTPLRPTDTMRAPYRDMAEPMQTHSAMITFMDQQIGRVLTKLKELRLEDKTLVLFASDNGAVLNRGGNNGHLRGEKWTIYEGGIRVPCIMRWPGYVQRGHLDNDSVLNICDLAPTFCHVAGAKMAEGYVSDGELTSDVLAGKQHHRTKPMYWHHPTGAARCPELAIRDGDWKLLMDPNGERLALYNLKEDVAETTNAAVLQPEIVARLSAKLREWYRSL